MTTITRTQIEAVLNKIVDEDPNYIYRPVDEDGCLYTERDGSAGCIFGRAFDELGIDRPSWYSDLNKESISILLEQLDVEVDAPETLDFMMEVQTQQDNGKEWWYAVAHAKELLG